MKAEIVADSICVTRITTMELTMPKWLVAQLNTHRCFSRNSASSRAIPLKKIREQVLANPYIPSEWPQNQRGMEGGEPLDVSLAQASERAWRHALATACKQHEWLEHFGVHKEIANRLLEPFMWTKVVVTSTEWDNFFALRLPGAGAQHEMGKLAVAMKRAMDASTPRRIEPGRWHMPYADTGDDVLWCADSIARSVARCARVSYMNHGKDSTLADDHRLVERLRESGHWSPFEHQAAASNHAVRSRNFIGWYQYRGSIDDAAKTENEG